MVRRLAAQARPAQDVLDAFDRCTRLVPEAPKAAFTCKDADDQKFIDLAIAQRVAALLTRDRALLRLAARARRFGVVIAPPEQWLPWPESHI